MLRKINRNKGENEENIVGTIIKNVENRHMPETISLWDQHVNISKVFQKQIKMWLPQLARRNQGYLEAKLNAPHITGVFCIRKHLIQAGIFNSEVVNYFIKNAVPNDTIFCRNIAR